MTDLELEHLLIKAIGPWSYIVSDREMNEVRLCAETTRCGRYAGHRCHMTSCDSIHSNGCSDWNVLRCPCQMRGIR